jgi:hypothetical protein
MSLEEGVARRVSLFFLILFALGSSKLGSSTKAYNDPIVQTQSGYTTVVGIA